MKFLKKHPKRTEYFFVQWHLLDHCNLHCAHCYQPDAVLRKIEYADALSVLNKLDEFFKDKEVTPQINLTGGEPLLYPQLFDLIEEIVKRGWRWALLTNGILLDQEKVTRLKALKPVFIQVSLEGDQEINDSCRGDGSFLLICDAIRLLVKNKVKCLVSFTITSRNWREYPKVAALCKSLGVHKLWCDRYVGNDDQKISTEDFSQFLQILKRERQLAAKEKAAKGSKTILAAERALMFQADGSCYRCNAGGTLLIIMPDGQLLPCRRLELPLGNILKDNSSIEEILAESENWAKLKKPLYSQACISCKDFNRCKGGAKCITYAQTNSLWGKDVNCSL